MQALVEQEVGAVGKRLPGRERAEAGAVGLLLRGIVDIVAVSPRAGPGVLGADGPQPGPQVLLRPAQGGESASALRLLRTPLRAPRAAAKGERVALHAGGTERGGEERGCL